MSPSLQMRPGSTSRVMLTHKTHDCGRQRILMLCMKNPCMTRNLECGLRYPIPHDFIGLLEEDEITYSWFQQDVAIAHTANNSMKLLNEIFGERVISRNLWPPHSPDLTPPDFYLWGVAKYAVYRDCPCKLNELKTAITTYIRNITQADLQKMFANKIKRVQTCIDTRGHHFQHLS